jgi:general secretion pathway protein A
MYEKFYQLTAKPFDLVPNPDFFFLSRSHRKALTYLRYGIREKIGFILLTGEVGSGKTTLLRDLIKGLNGDVVLSTVFNTKVSSEQLLSLINEDFGLQVEGKKKTTLLRDLNDFLIEQYAGRRQVMLIVDEAQNLTAELLEEIRMLSNLETNSAKLLQIILVGQPELRDTLGAPGLRQLRQRISISCQINPLSRQETESYIYHRLEKAGNRAAVDFAEGSMDIIHEYSRGIPRLVNIICDLLMLTSYTEGTRSVTAEAVRDIVTELEEKNHFWRDKKREKEPEAHHISMPKELANFLRRLETHIYTHDLSLKEKKEMLSRVSMCERTLSGYLVMTRSELTRIYDNVRLMNAEMKELRERLLELERRVEHAEDYEANS